MSNPNTQSPGFPGTAREQMRHHARQAARWASDASIEDMKGNRSLSRQYREQARRHQTWMRELQGQQEALKQNEDDLRRRLSCGFIAGESKD